MHSPPQWCHVHTDASRFFMVLNIGPAVERRDRMRIKEENMSPGREEMLHIIDALMQFVGGGLVGGA